MPFDIAGARQAGYTDAEIADFLAPTSKFDVAGARAAGYGDDEIVGHLTQIGQEPTQIEEDESVLDQAGRAFTDTVSDVKDVGNLARRSAARLAGGVATLPEVILSKAETGARKSREQSGEMERIRFEGDQAMLAKARANPDAFRKEMEAVGQGSKADAIIKRAQESQPQEFEAEELAPFEPSVAVKGLGAAREKAAEWEQAAVAALSPEARAGVESNLVERDAEENLQLGAGARDPWWWTANIIDLGAQALPGIGTAGTAAKMSYGAKFAGKLAELSAQKVPQSIAIAEARAAAEAAAKQAAIIAGGLTEGSLAGGMGAKQTIDTLNQIDEATLMAYEPYRELRERGLTHEAARDQVARDQAFSVALASAAVVGLTGAPLNNYVAKWVNKIGPAKSRARVAGEAAVLEGSQEAVQEGAEQVIQNKGEQPITGKETWDGVLESAITGAVLGGVVGGGIGAAAGPNDGSGSAPQKTTPAAVKPAATPKKPTNQAATEAELPLAQQEFNKARDGLRAARASGDTKTIRAALDVYKQASVNRGAELLRNGQLDDAAQQTVAKALQDAKADGVEPPPVVSLKVDKKAQDVNLKLYDAIANAGEISEADLQGLVAKGEARVSTEGLPILTPLGRRNRKAAQTALKAATVAAEKVTDQPAKTPAEKAAKPKAAAPKKPAIAAKSVKSEPAKQPALKPVQKPAVSTKSEQPAKVNVQPKAVSTKRVQKPKVDKGGKTDIAFSVSRNQLPAVRRAAKTAPAKGVAVVQTGDQAWTVFNDRKPLQTYTDEATANEDAAALQPAKTEKYRIYENGTYSKNLIVETDDKKAAQAKLRFLMAQDPSGRYSVETVGDDKAPVAFSVAAKGNEVIAEAGGGKMRAEIQRDQKRLQVREAELPREARGQKHGIAMAEELFAEAKRRGLSMVSDNRVSEAAARVYEGLERRGYKIKRNPANVDPATGELVSKSEFKGVFEVTDGPNATATSTKTTTDQGVSDAATQRVQEPSGVRRSTGVSKAPVGQRPSLVGLPAKQEVKGRGVVEFGAFAPAHDAAEAYTKAAGVKYKPSKDYAKLDRTRAARIAQAYDQMKHAPDNPRVKKAYAAMIAETLAQYQEIKKTGLKIEPIPPGNPDPYAVSPRLAILDVVENNHLWFFPTDSGFGGPNATLDVSDNPLLADTGERIGDHKMLANDVFRVVHDYFGHIKDGVGFRAEGEENAWRSHSAMYSPLARAAMTTETRGQNSWLNFGPYAEKNRTANAAETEYAPQKTGLLPEEFWRTDEEGEPELSPARQAAQDTIRKVAGLLTADEKAKINQAAAKKLIRLFNELPNEKELAAAAIAGQAKRGWYRQSAEAIVNVFGPDAPRFVALLAALSPQNSVQMNLTNAVAVWAEWIKSGRPTSNKGIVDVMGRSVLGGYGGILGAWKNNLIRALSSRNPESVTLSGPKVNSFAANLRGETDAVTLDAWMANFALVDQRIFKGALTKGGSPGKGPGYLAYSARVRQAAKYLTEKTGEQWTPAEVQETIWSWAKALYEEAESFGALATAQDLVENQELTDELIAATPDFATLFNQPEYEQVLRDAGYGEQLDALAERKRTADSPRKKVPALEGDQKRLIAAAKRLDKLKAQRDAEEIAAAFSVLEEEFVEATRQPRDAGKGMDVDAVGKAVDEIEDVLGVEVEVVASIEDLPPAVRKATLGLPVKGVFYENPSDGQSSLFLVGENLTSGADVRTTAIHEIVGHFGLRGVLGDKYSETMAAIFRSFPSQVATVAARNGINLRHSDPKARESLRNLAAEEVVAYATERVLSGDVSKKQTVWSKIVAVVRDALRKIGLLAKYSESDIDNLILQARDHVVLQGRRNRAAQIRYEGDMRQAAAAAVKSTGNKDLDSFMGKIGGEKESLKTKYKNLTTNLKDRFIVAAFDHFHGIKRAEDLAGITAGDSGYKSVRLSGGASELTQAMIEYGYPVWNDGAPDVAGGRGLLDIMRPLGDKVDLWLTYLVAKRASRLFAEGRENLFTQNEINAGLDLGRQHPEFIHAAKAYGEFQAKVLDFAQEAGIIDPQSRAMWENADYVPFYRLIENGQVQQSGRAGVLGKVRNQIRQLKGGTAKLGDPLENIVRNWLAMTDAALKAHATRQVVDNLDGTGFITKVPNVEITQAIVPKSEIKKFMATNPEIVKSLAAVGVDVTQLSPQAFLGMQKMLAVKAPTDEDIISVWRNGKREYWRVYDDLLLEGLMGVDAKAWGPLMEIFRYPRRLLTQLVTSTPAFAIRNAWRDMWSVFIQGIPGGARSTIIPGVDTAKGLVTQLRMDKNAISMLAGGGSFTHGYARAGDTSGAAKTVRRSLQKGGVSTILDSPKKLWMAYTRLLNASENANRVAVYNSVIKAGGSRREALFQARDVLDFSMRGNNPITRFMIESVPFMNARMQGLYRLGRGFRQNFMAIALRGLLLTSAALALLARNHDDERYKELTDDQKDTYWHLWDVFQEGDHWKIPKPFEVGAIFGTIPEAIAEAMYSEEPDATQEALGFVGHSFANQLDLLPRPQAIWPLLELAMNKNSFTGAPILTQGDEGKLPEEQDNAGIAPTYRMIARAMPEAAPDALRSPKQLQHLARGYFGTMGDYVLAATDVVAREVTGDKNSPKKRIDDYPLMRDFRTIGPAKHTKYVDLVYELADEAAKVHNSIRDLRADMTEASDERADELETENIQLLDVRQTFVRAADRITDLRKRQRALQADGEMDPEEKRVAMDEYQERINEAAKSVYDLRPGGTLNPDEELEVILSAPGPQAQMLNDAGLRTVAELVKQ